MAKKDEFNQTRILADTFRRDMSHKTTMHEVMSLLNVIVPFKEGDPTMQGAPTKLVNGVVHVDTETLKTMFRAAVSQKNHDLVPDVLGLRTAAKNIIDDANQRDTLREDSAGPTNLEREIAVQLARANTPLPSLPIVRNKNPDFNETRPYDNPLDLPFENPPDSKD